MIQRSDETDMDYQNRILDLGLPSLRDRFAMAALTGLVASTDTAPEVVAVEAYRIADAMLKERST